MFKRYFTHIFLVHSCVYGRLGRCAAQSPPVVVSVGAGENIVPLRLRVPNYNIRQPLPAPAQSINLSPRNINELPSPALIGHQIHPNVFKVKVAYSDDHVARAGEGNCANRTCNGHGICRADDREINGYICECDWHWSGRDCLVEGPGTFWPIFIAAFSTVVSFALIALLVTAR